MNFLELAGNLEEYDDLEIIEDPPARVNMPLVASDKGKGTSIAPSKRKTGSHVGRTKKLMTDALSTRSSKMLANIEILERKEMGKKERSGLRVGANKVFGSNWSISEETMLLTPYKRAEWSSMRYLQVQRADSSSYKSKR